MTEAEAAEVDGTEMKDPLLEMIVGRSRHVTTVGTTIVETEEDTEDQDGRTIR